jgi:predicted MFS family arabinose efflux permease
MGVSGLGVGAAFTAFPALITRAVPPGETGSAMSLNQVLRYVGFATGSALTATLLEAATPEGGAVPSTTGYTAIGLIACAVALATVVAALPLLRRRAPIPDAVITEQ